MKLVALKNLIKGHILFTLYMHTSAPPSRLRRSVTPRTYGPHFWRLRRSVSYGCWPLVSNFPTELSAHAFVAPANSARARSASPRARATLTNPM